MTEITDTHRRAKLRGRESVAKWRIESGVWAGRLFAVLYGVLTIFPLLRRDGPDWASAAVLVVIAAGLLIATERMRHGSRAAACVLLSLFLAAKLGAWALGGEPLWRGALWSVIILGALANGVWGTFALAAVRRDAALVPPAPPRASARPPAV